MTSKRSGHLRNAFFRITPAYREQPRHLGTYQYWKPVRRWTYAKTARVAWAFSLTLILVVFSFAVVATVVMLTKLPPELPMEVLNR